MSQIFTSYLTRRPSGPGALQLVRDLAAHRGAVYVPAWLECPEEELARRMPLPERQERAKMRDPNQLRAVLRESGVLPPPPGAIRIDTAELAPADAARLLAAHAGAPL